MEINTVVGQRQQQQQQRQKQSVQKAPNSKGAATRRDIARTAHRQILQFSFQGQALLCQRSSQMPLLDQGPPCASDPGFPKPATTHHPLGSLQPVQACRTAALHMGRRLRCQSCASALVCISPIVAHAPVAAPRPPAHACDPLAARNPSTSSPRLTGKGATENNSTVRPCLRQKHVRTALDMLVCDNLLCGVCVWALLFDVVPGTDLQDQPRPSNHSHPVSWPSDFRPTHRALLHRVGVASMTTNNINRATFTSHVRLYG
jgi:hypothetical protein